MSSPIVFSLTATQRDFLAALALNPATWPNFPRSTRQNAHERGYTTSAVKPRLTPLGEACAGLALVLVGLAHIPVSKPAPVQAGEPETAPRGSAVLSV